MHKRKPTQAMWVYPHMVVSVSSMTPLMWQRETSLLGSKWQVSPKSWLFLSSIKGHISITFILSSYLFPLFFCPFIFLNLHSDFLNNFGIYNPIWSQPTWAFWPSSHSSNLKTQIVIQTQFFPLYNSSLLNFELDKQHISYLFRSRLGGYLKISNV